MHTRVTRLRAGGQILHRLALVLSCLSATVACQRTSSPDPARTTAAPSGPAPAPRATPLPDAPAQLSKAAESADVACQPDAELVLPAVDQLPGGAQARFESGDSHLYYYGIGRAVDYVQARYAALAEIERDQAPVFGGHAILMMLYANGYGVQRNVELALKLACKVEAAPAEQEGRVQHLRSLRAGPEKQPFDLCDDITSGMMRGACAGLEAERRGVEHDTQLSALTRGLPPPQAAAFRRLQQAAEAFWHARIYNEVDLSGSARAAFAIEEDTALKDAFRDALARHARGELPTGNAADAIVADEELNDTYKKAIAHDWSGTTITAVGIRDTERRWLKYRDAFMAYAAMRYPQVSAESWQTWLDRVRAQQLLAMIEP